MNVRFLLPDCIRGVSDRMKAFRFVLCIILWVTLNRLLLASCLSNRTVRDCDLCNTLHTSLCTKDSPVFVKCVVSSAAVPITPDLQPGNTSVSHET